MNCANRQNTLTDGNVALVTPDMLRHVEAVAAAAMARGLKLMTAESCTGGMIAAALTAVAGASEWFLGGIVSYDNRVKQQLLGVSAETLTAHGAVSAETACEMAAGLTRYGADVALSVTGVCGPCGGSDAKPVGTVWFGFQFPGAAPLVRRQLFPDGGRDANRQAAALYALATLDKLMRQPSENA